MASVSASTAIVERGAAPSATPTNGSDARGLALRSAAQHMDLQTISRVFVQSGFFQDTKDAAQALVKVLAGAELGFGPIASMQGVYIVKGKVTLAANLIAAQIQRSKRFRYRVARLDNERCELVFFELGEEIGRSSFTLEDARAANLLGNATYKQFPRNMLFARALTNGARWFCPEVFNGPIYTPDELGAEVDEDGQVVRLPPPAEPILDTHDQDAADLKAAGPEAFSCQKCGVILAEVELGGRVYSATDWLHKTRKALGGEYCGDCGKQRKREIEAERRYREVFDVDEAAPSTPAEASATDLWAERRQLEAEADELGLKLKPLNVRSTREQIAAQNTADRQRVQQGGRALWDRQAERESLEATTAPPGSAEAF